PGTYQAVYNGTKALLDSFSYALRAELRDSGVTVTCLMPGATETEFFERADMLDTELGTERKQSPQEVARIGFEAMMKGQGDHAITHVVDVRAESRDDRQELSRAGIRLLWLPTADQRAFTQLMIVSGVEWITRAFDQGGRVLVHCQNGMGRSALLALCVLVQH